MDSIQPTLTKKINRIIVIEYMAHFSAVDSVKVAEGYLII